MRGFSLPSVVDNMEQLQVNDIIITGMSYEDGAKFNRMLQSKGIYNVVYYNHVPSSLLDYDSILQHKMELITKFPMLDSYFESDLDQFNALSEFFPGMTFINE